MIKIVTILFSFFCSQAIASTTLQNLLAVNSEWRTKTQFVSIANTINQYVQASNHNDWIKVHLLATAQLLSNANTTKLSASQQSNRMQLIAILHQYALAGKYPINTFLSYTNPVFIDNFGTHCAVGYLMQQSGAAGIAHAINAKQQFAYIKDIHRADVDEWASKNGFTKEELAMIQPGYASTLNVNAIAGGVNGAVRCMAKIDENTFIIGGDFTKELKNNATCNHLAFVTNYNNIWEINPVLNGVNGAVNVLYNYENKIIIGGNFTNANGVAVNNLASYDILISGQPFAAFGSFDGSVNCITTYDNKLFVGGSFTEFVKWKDSITWQIMPNNIITGGKINALQVFNNELYIGGQFEIPTGAPRKNVVKYTTALGMQSSGFGTATPVNDFEIFNNQLLAACTFIEGIDTCALAILNANQEWDKAIIPYQYSGLAGFSFQTLFNTNGKLYVGGNYVYNGFTYFGKNMGEIIISSNLFYHSPLITIDSSIYNLFAVANKLCLLGDFSSNQFAGTQAIQKIGFLDLGPSAIAILKNDFTFSIFPNPSNGIINISTNLQLQNADSKIYNMQGGLVSKSKVINDKINASQLSNGMYQLEITIGSKKSSLLFQKK